jgi:transcriptional regulator with XRE-family HTH domain
MDGRMAGRLKQLRDQKGLSQTELGTKLGCKRQTIYQYENGASVPDANDLITLSNVFEADIDYITCRTDDNLYDTQKLNKMYVKLSKESQNKILSYALDLLVEEGKI